MAFHFKLEKILHHRKNLENIARKDFAEAADVLHKEKLKLEKLYQDIDNSRISACEIQTNGGAHAAESLCQIHDFIKGTEILIERQKLKVRESAKIVEDKQEILRQASIEYKMIERLKEKRKEAYRLDMKKLEEKKLNEINMTRFKPGNSNE